MLISLLLAAAAPSAVCTKLSQDFDENEYSMAVMHDLNAKLLDTSRKMEIGFGSPRMRREREEAEAKLKADDAEYLAKGNSITTLMIAHKCTPPDHVTDWFTYSATNPKRKVYTPSK